MNYIIVKDTTISKVECSVWQLAEMYKDSGFLNTITINRVDFNVFLIEFPENLDFVSFAVYVNYIRYPEGLKDYNPTVYGIWNVTEPINKISAKNGESLLLYVSQFDKEYDNVSIVNSLGQVYLYSFTGSISMIAVPSEYNYSELVVPPLSYSHIIDIVLPDESDKQETKPWWKFW